LTDIYSAEANDLRPADVMALDEEEDDDDDDF
jgi:hypothetical protein